EQGVAGRVVIARLLIIKHAVKGRVAGWGRVVAPGPTVGGAAADAAVGRLQPAIEFDLAREASPPIARGVGRAGPERGDCRESVGREGVLVAEVVVARPDAGRPGLRGGYQASPGRIPRKEEIGGVVSRTCPATRA